MCRFELALYIVKICYRDAGINSSACSSYCQNLVCYVKSQHLTAVVRLCLGTLLCSLNRT